MSDWNKNLAREIAKGIIATGIEGGYDSVFLGEIGYNYIEIFELSSLTLKENGADLAGATDLTYVADYENVD